MAHRLHLQASAQGGSLHKQPQASKPAVRHALKPLRAVSGVRVAQAPPAVKQAPLQQWQADTGGSPAAQPRRVSRLQQQQQSVAPAPQRQRQQLLKFPTQSTHSPAAPAAAIEALPEWAARFRRQLHALPAGGEAALVQLLQAVDGLLCKAEFTGPHRHVLQAYMTLGLLDIVAQAWQQRTAELQAAEQVSSSPQLQRALVEASLSLAGCRYLRIETSNELGRQLHLLLDGQGHSPALHLDALPAPHALGLPIRQLLRHSLGINLRAPALRSGSTSSAATAASLELDDGDLRNLTWEQYATASADASMCGDWLFCYWQGDATWRPAPFAKFSTSELVALLTPATVLTSLANGIWGRALVNAAHEYGLTLDCHNGSTSAAEAVAARAAAQATAARAAAAAAQQKQQHVGESMVLPARGLSARVRQLRAAVQHVRTVSAATAPGAAEASAQSN